MQHIKLYSEKINAVLFKKMTYYMTVMTSILAVLKLSIVILDNVLRSNHEGSPMFACNINEDTIYLVDETGFFYLAISALQFLVTADMIRISIYESTIGVLE